VRVFAFEFFSGGGLAQQPLPASLAREGDLILTSLVGELAEVAGVEVVASRDPRLPVLAGCRTILPDPGEDPASLYARGLAAADAAWPTASESGGALERFASETVASGKTLLGCSPAAVRLTASKRATARVLHRAGITAVPTFALLDPPPSIPGPWVVKPDTGAGCESTELVFDWAAALERLRTEPGRLVAQPWIEGEPLSLSMICARGAARLLACNRQAIGLRDGRISLERILVNAVPDGDGRWARLADRIAAAIPGLWGYVGVDLVLSPAGPVVLEINPRLTTSYCGLRVALGINTAALVLGLLGTEGELPTAGPAVAGGRVEIGLEPAGGP
jgi:predicted ATP-grasp superfamily ATP-dependent carboligase